MVMVFSIIFRFEDNGVGSITNISFSNVWPNEDYNYQKNDKQDEDDEHFVCPDFIVVDLDAKITLLQSSFFE